jgi:hypothetical protein
MVGIAALLGDLCHASIAYQQVRSGIQAGFGK